MRCACGGCSRGSAGGNEGGRPARSFSDERQYAYKAFFGGESEEGTLPIPQDQSVLCEFLLLAKNRSLYTLPKAETPS